MSDIYRGTTHDFEFDLGADLSEVSYMWVTVSQFGREIFTKDLDDITIDGSAVKLHLTQENTLALKPKMYAYIQIRYLLNDGNAEITETIKRNVQDCLKDGVIGASDDVPDVPEDEGNDNP